LLNELGNRRAEFGTVFGIRNGDRRSGKTSFGEKTFGATKETDAKVVGTVGVGIQTIAKKMS
jgi:hypothetical protein